jgi:mRNA interferase MazF
MDSHTHIELFDEWSWEKKVLNNITTYPSFKEGEIWWCAIWKNIGREMYGKWNQFTRPVYVLKKVSKEMFIGIPLSSQEKKGTWFYKIETKKNTHFAILPQIRLFGAQRILWDKLSSLPEEHQKEIKKYLGEYLNL